MCYPSLLLPVPLKEVTVTIEKLNLEDVRRAKFAESKTSPQKRGSKSATKPRTSRKKKAAPAPLPASSDEDDVSVSEK